MEMQVEVLVHQLRRLPVVEAEKVHLVTEVAPLPIAVMEERAPLQQLLAHRLLTQPEVVGQPLASAA
jgi:hypothetical protein